MRRLKNMERAGADIAKIAVMPQKAEDVLELLSATLKAVQSMSCPVITMSMGKKRNDQPCVRRNIWFFCYLWEYAYVLGAGPDRHRSLAADKLAVLHGEYIQ